jgi:photosynthetic reaction center cytochrome c subunit
MKLWVVVTGAIAVLLTGIMFWKAGWNLPPVEATQTGYRGTGMVQYKDPQRQAALIAANVPPPPPYEADATGPRAIEAHPGLQVLGDLSEDQLVRLMASITEWVSPEQGCAYCHNVENMADRSLYTHKVATRMLQMTRTINSQWTSHVANTGVTCYTCHQGKPVPANVWFKTVGPGELAGGQSGWMGFRNGQNIVSVNTGLTSLPYDSLSEYLLNNRNARITSNTALPTGNKAGTMDAEHTYAFMNYMSTSVGANCVVCHNSRAFNSWDESPPQRVTAWHGIQMARALNVDYLVPLTSVFPPHRLGPTGDVAKVGCATCHNGLQKPLNGVSMLKDYLAELGGGRKP